MDIIVQSYSLAESDSTITFEKVKKNLFLKIPFLKGLFKSTQPWYLKGLPYLTFRKVQNRIQAVLPTIFFGRLGL